MFCRGSNFHIKLGVATFNVPYEHLLIHCDETVSSLFLEKIIVKADHGDHNQLATRDYF